MELARVEAHVRRQLIRRLNKLQREAMGRIGVDDLDNINARQLSRLIRDIDKLANTAYSDMIRQSQDYSGELAQDETDFIYREFGKKWGAPKRPPAITSPLVLGATIGEWLSKQGRDYAHNVTMAVRNQDSIAPLGGRFNNALKAFTTTLTSSTVNQRRIQVADKSSYILGYQHNSVLDSRVSDICLVRHLKRWNKDKQPIGHDLDYRETPLHPHCRSFITFIFDFYDDSKINGITVDDWLDSMNEAEQNEVLGVGKAAMYRRGDITLRDLLDQSGRPQPLYRLQEKQDKSKVPSMVKMHRTPWADGFPDTVIDRPLGDATKHPLYEKAKAGDAKSAYLLAKDLVADDAVEKLRRLKGNKSIVIVPVHAEEAVGRNKIPLAVATILDKKLKAPVVTNITQATKVARTGKDGWYRLANPPAFDGSLPQNSLVLLVDDTQTQGGTFAALKGHIEAQNSRVIGTYALTGKQYSVQLRISKETLIELRNEYSRIETWWQEEFGYGFESLTEWEARYILKSGKSPDEVRNTILARRSKAGS